MRVSSGLAATVVSDRMHGMIQTKAMLLVVDHFCVAPVFWTESMLLLTKLLTFTRIFLKVCTKITLHNFTLYLTFITFIKNGMYLQESIFFYFHMTRDRQEPHPDDITPK